MYVHVCMCLSMCVCVCVMCLQGVQSLMDDYKERPLYKAAHIFFLESEIICTHIHTP